MTKNTSYSLVDYREDSDNFYVDLGLFTDTILGELDTVTDGFVREYCDFLDTFRIENLRSRNEYVVEFLMIGLYWNIYSGNAIKTGNLSKKLLRTLYAQRKRFPSYKPEIDKVRGFLAYLFLEKHMHSQSTRYNLRGFISLLGWLSATGEFNEEVLRLRNWVEFGKTRNESYFTKLIETSVLFAERFSEKGKKILGKYLQNLNNFHKNKLQYYKYREDYFFASRRENEYLLNMFAAEILNRELMKGFVETRKKILLLPTCMRNEPATGCRAKSDGKELVCNTCSRKCNVGKVSFEMKKEGITTYLIPHSSDFSRFLVKWKDCPDTSLIGVACILNLLAGGYEMKRLNISSQCVFLDYCGCKKHWDEEGFATSINISQLKRIVQKPGLLNEKKDLN